MDSSSAPVQHFNLRWNNYTNNILQVFSEHLSNENLVDVTISCQGKFIKAHKMVLSACSPYFQELFQIHQVPHPVIIVNGMTFLDVKLVVDFMYHGEVKVQEGDLGGLLLAAETLQVKGLANVRNKYEQGQIQRSNSTEDVKPDISSQSAESILQPPSNKMEQEKTPQEVIPVDSHHQSQSGPSTSTTHVIDDDLPPTIKVEPPDIRDIDEEPAAGWDSPRLIIDMKESKETMTDFKRIETTERKRPNILRPAIRVASAHLELSDEERATIKKEPHEISSSAKCFVIPKRQPKLLGTWGRQKVYKIPRPPNAFMIFANDWRRKLAIKYPVESNKDISVRLGTMWKNLNADDKETYYSAARKADEDHKMKYPGYYYSPKEARLRKGLKERRRLVSTVPPMDALRYVKVYMTNAEKQALMTERSTSLLRKIQPKPDNKVVNADSTPILISTLESMEALSATDQPSHQHNSGTEDTPIVVDSS